MARLTDGDDPEYERELRAAWVTEPPKLDGQIRLADYDPAWPGLFEREAARIRAVLGDRVLRLEHIGSTSVPGLAAKPIIDMLLIVADPADEDAYVAPLEQAGYRLSHPRARLAPAPAAQGPRHRHQPARARRRTARRSTGTCGSGIASGPIRPTAALYQRTKRELAAQDCDLHAAVRRRQVGRRRGDPAAQLARAPAAPPAARPARKSSWARKCRVSPPSCPLNGYTAMSLGPA